MRNRSTKKIKIEALGGFTIERDDSLVDIECLGDSKPIEMLKLLIAYGGRNMAIDFVTSKLWEDAEGDRAKNCFDNTLFRLRKILGDKDAVTLDSGMLSINAKVCWVDLFAFENLIKNSVNVLNAQPINPELVLALARDLSLIYRGPCFWLAKEFSWGHFIQEKTKTKFLRFSLELGRAFESLGMNDDAVSVYAKALEHYPLSEEICLQMIKTRINQGLLVEALVLFKNFSKELRDSFGLEPSGAMLRVISTISH